mgnify:CR=1 FL=1
MISDKIEAIKAAVNEQLAKSEHLQDVQDIRVKFLGKKGDLTAIMKEMKNFSKEERPKVGQLVNTARNAIEEQHTPSGHRPTRPCRQSSRHRPVHISSFFPFS